MKTFKSAAIAATLAFAASASQASITQFSGSDNGASTSGPWVNSTNAATAFTAAASAFGTMQTATFEGLSTTYAANFNASPNLSVNLTGPVFSGFSGVVSGTQGNLYGFNTTSGGSQWLGFPNGTATLNFAGGTNSVGFFLTGVQTSFTTAIDITFNDGTSQLLHAPINVDGGVAYFGFTDTQSFNSITISNISSDAWGIDDVSFNTAAEVPEPSDASLMLLGLVGLAAFVRLRRQAK